MFLLYVNVNVLNHVSVIHDKKKKMNFYIRLKQAERICDVLESVF